MVEIVLLLVVQDAEANAQADVNLAVRDATDLALEDVLIVAREVVPIVNIGDKGVR